MTSLGVPWTDTHSRESRRTGRIATGIALAFGSAIQNVLIRFILSQVPRMLFKDALFRVVAAGAPQPNSSAAITDGVPGHASKKLVRVNSFPMLGLAWELVLEQQQLVEPYGELSRQLHGGEGPTIQTLVCRHSRRNNKQSINKLCTAAAIRSIPSRASQ